MSTKKIFINGEWIKPHSKKTMDIVNPATGKLLGVVIDCDKSDVNHAVISAKNAQQSWWRDVSPLDKAKLMHQLATKFRERQQEIGKVLALETGKPLIEAVDCIDWVAQCFEYYGEFARSSFGNSIPPSAAHQINFTIKEPFGVVAAIVPFNFPLLLMAWKVAPAIAAGNTVVLKCPHQNPLSSLLVAECFQEILPPGVVNVITGGGATTGEHLIQHPDVDLIAFTGSCKVGRHIASVAGSQLKKINLELGSVDPFVVFADADLDVAVKGAAWARLLNAGQVCTSSKRIYVDKKIAPEFIKRIEKFVKTLKQGDPIQRDTDIGPVISKEALDTVDKQVKICIKEGAKLLLGGKPAKLKGLNGFFYEPTILVNVKHGSYSTREEIFGPIICITTFDGVDQGIEMANDSKYGLGCCIYTSSLETSMKAMENIKAGSFWVNDPLTDNNAGPFGGMRWSGVGRELGPEGLDAFREPKHVHIDYIQEVKSYWFPYKNRT